MTAPDLCGEIVLITGIMAAGKSTVAQALAERLPRSVHLRGDLFRRMIVNGRAEVTPENWDEAERQVEVRYRIATQAARSYAEAGFAVVYQDIMLGEALERVVAMLNPKCQPVSVVVLAPSLDVVTQRENDREKTGYGDWTPHELDASLRDETPRIGLWLDTSEMTIDATVDTILDRLDEARVAAPRR